MGEMTVVVGAGLAGLACARELARLGRPFVVLEAEGEPGGRVRSEKRDGFILDRGFQVVLSSYDAVDALVDREALCPRYFESGALLWHEGTFCHLANPLRHPVLLPQTLLAFPPGDSLRISALVAEVLVRQDADLLAGCGRPGDQSTRAFLEERGFGQSFLRRFAVPFFGGVLLDADLETSAALFRYYLKKFATGRAWLPACGIGRLPAEVARPLGEGAIRYGARVAALEVSEGHLDAVVLEGRTRIPCCAAVLALDAPSLARLTGRPMGRPGRSVSVAYFRTRESLYPSRCLVLPSAHPSRRIHHFCQVSNISRELAPDGWHLVSTTVLGDDPASVDGLRDEVAAVFPGAGSMEHIATLEVPFALPSQPAGFAAGPAVEPPACNVFFAGDALGASIQNALETGREAARRAVAGKA